MSDNPYWNIKRPRVLDGEEKLFLVPITAEVSMSALDGIAATDQSLTQLQESLHKEIEASRK